SAQSWPGVERTEVLYVAEITEIADAISRRRASGPSGAHGVARHPFRQRCPPRTSVSGRDGASHVWHGVLLGGRTEVLGGQGRVLASRGVRGRVHAEPDVRRGV